MYRISHRDTQNYTNQEHYTTIKQNFQFKFFVFKTLFMSRRTESSIFLLSSWAFLSSWSRFLSEESLRDNCSCRSAMSLFNLAIWSSRLINWKVTSSFCQIISSRYYWNHIFPYHTPVNHYYHQMHDCFICNNSTFVPDFRSGRAFHVAQRFLPWTCGGPPLFRRCPTWAWFPAGWRSGLAPESLSGGGPPRAPGPCTGCYTAAAPGPWSQSFSETLVPVR